MATNGNFAHQEQYKSSTDPYPAAPASTETASSTAGNSNLSKDEVGWYFVEQYYTTLSKSPEKLHVCVSASQSRPRPPLTCQPPTSSSMASALSLSRASRLKSPTSPSAARFVHASSALPASSRRP